MLTPARKPRPADVARWVAVLAAPLCPRTLRVDYPLEKAAHDKARTKLRSFGLGDDGAPLADVAEVSP